MPLSDDLLYVHALGRGLGLVQAISNKKPREKRMRDCFVGQRYVIWSRFVRVSHISPKIGKMKHEGRHLHQNPVVI
jgi:hypothetical protein